MTIPFYASAEQVMRDRSEFARKGIARGRSVVVLTYSGGVLFVAENLSTTLHKVSEIYDRIGFAAVGRYSEFENLRTAGVRLADLRGYSYDRRDVTGRWLANAYAQTLGSIFTEQQKPYEVEVCVAEVGESADQDELYRLTYDGSIQDEPDLVVMGGQADAISTALKESYRRGMELGEAIRTAVAALSSVSAANAQPLGAKQLEVAVLERSRPRRAFRRIAGAALEELLATPDKAPDKAEDKQDKPAGEAPAGDAGKGDAAKDESAKDEPAKGGKGRGGAAKGKAKGEDDSATS